MNYFFLKSFLVKKMIHFILIKIVISFTMTTKMIYIIQIIIIILINVGYQLILKNFYQKLNASELAGYNTIKNELEYYTNQIKFEITEINNEIFSLYSPCLNNIEYSYHIKNIYNKQCPYYYNKIK